MKVRVFTLRYAPDLGGFDDSAVVAFLGEREAIAISDHVLTLDGEPAIVLMVTYRDAKEPLPLAPSVRRRDERQQEVATVDRDLFEALRRWRNERARHDGRPPYVLFTNPQLAGIASVRPATRAALGAISGVGDARVHAFADEILAIVAKIPPTLPGAAAPISPPESSHG